MQFKEVFIIETKQIRTKMGFKPKKCDPSLHIPPTLVQAALVATHAFEKVDAARPVRRERWRANGPLGHDVLPLTVLAVLTRSDDDGASKRRRRF